MNRTVTQLALLIALPALLSACTSTADPQPARAAAPIAAPGTYDGAIVDAACGECQFGLTGDSCDLAVRIDGQAWFVDGSAIDDHGDAHASDGFCNAVRQARVSGRVVDDRFVATEFELLPDDEG